MLARGHQPAEAIHRLPDVDEPRVGGDRCQADDVGRPEVGDDAGQLDERTIDAVGIGV